MAPVAVTEFIVTTRSRGTTCGSAAENLRVTNLLKPLTVARTAQNEQVSGAHRQWGGHHAGPPPPRRRSLRSAQYDGPSGPTARAGEQAEVAKWGRTAPQTLQPPRVGGPLQIEQQSAGQTDLEKTVAELAGRPQLNRRQKSGGCGPIAGSVPEARASTEPTVQNLIAALSRAMMVVAQPKILRTSWRPQRTRVRAGTLLLANVDLLEPTFPAQVSFTSSNL